MDSLDMSRAEMELILAEIGAWGEPILCRECEGSGVLAWISGGYVEPIWREAPCGDCEDGFKMCVECGHTPAYQIDESYDQMCPDCMGVLCDMDEELVPYRNALYEAAMGLDS